MTLPSLPLKPRLIGINPDGEPIWAYLPAPEQDREWIERHAKGTRK